MNDGDAAPSDPDLASAHDAAVEQPPFPTFRSVCRQFGRQFVVDAVIPVLLFLALSKTLGLAWAIVAATTWSAALIVMRWRAGRTIGPLVWFTLGFALLRGAAGIATGSGAVYFGPAVAGNFLVALVFAGSVILRRPTVGLIATVFYPFPDDVRNHRAYRRVFSRLTLAWAALETATGLLQVVLLATTTTNTYVIVRSLVSWPLGIGLFVFSLHYPRRAFAHEPDFAERFTTVTP